MAAIDAPLPSPGVGVRRKGPKDLPRLPRSAFTPPNSGGATDRFPLPPSPSTLHPTVVVDGHVVLRDGHLGELWRDSVGRTEPRDVSGIVLTLPGDGQRAAFDQVRKDHPSLKIVSVVVPVSLEQGPLSQPLPTFGGDTRVSLSIQFFKNSPQLVEGVKWALAQGYTVDVDVQAPMKNGEGWEGVEELLSEVLKVEGEGAPEAAPKGTIILSNILPPPHDLNISIVKLLNHPAYRAYQSNIASLSLFSSVLVKYIPPNWGTLTPGDAEGTNALPEKDSKEWKRRIKMFLGPTVEAFGFQRIIYGATNSSSDDSDSSDWYELARESLAEIGVDQEAVDAVFGGNASTAYGS